MEKLEKLIYKFESSQDSSKFFGKLPTLESTRLPFLKSISVGIPLTPNFCEVCGFSSTFNLKILSLSFFALPISSRIGPICLHGPHHYAQKSTKTGNCECLISSSKLLSLI